MRALRVIEGRKISTGEAFKANKTYWHIPTLPELIKECDIENHLNGKLKGFFTSLEKATRDTWVACGRIPNGETCSECGRNEDLLIAKNAKDPEVAVVKLYLKLNDKRTNT